MKTSSACVALTLLAIAYNNLMNLLPQGLHDLIFVPVNLSAAALAAFWARRLGLTWSELGLSAAGMGVGLKWGAGIGVGLTAPLFLAVVSPAPFGVWADPRGLASLSVGQMAYTTLLRIPLGTALAEELLFRGVMFGLWAKVRGRWGATLATSGAFSLWHVTATYELMAGTGFFESPALMWAAVAGGVAITFPGGLFFAWLRLKTGAIYGPFLAHWLINALAATAAFLAGR